MIDIRETKNDYAILCSVYNKERRGGKNASNLRADKHCTELDFYFYQKSLGTAPLIWVPGVLIYSLFFIISIHYFLKVFF